MGALSAGLSPIPLSCVDEADLAAKPTGSLLSGDLAYVASKVGSPEGALYFLNWDATEPVDGLFVLSTGRAEGRWLSVARYNGQIQTLSVSSYQALRDLDVATLRDGTSATVAGRVLPSDGGEGTFVWTASEVAPDNDGTILAPSLPYGGRWVRAGSESIKDVRWFGAVGDGLQNDLLAIQAAVDALGDGHVLYFPAGTYALDWMDGSHIGNLRFSNLSAITIRGDGDDSVVYDMRPVGNYDGESAGGAFVGPAAPVLGPTDTAGTFSMFDCADVTFDHLTIKGPGDGTQTVAYISRKGIYAPSMVGDWTLERCRFEDVIGETAYIYSAIKTTLWAHDCVFLRCSTNNYNLITASDESFWLIEGNEHTQCRSAGRISVTGGQPIILANKISQTSMSSGGGCITVENCKRFIVADNEVTNMTGTIATAFAAIMVWNTAAITKIDGLIEGNLIAGNVLGIGGLSGKYGAITLTKSPAGSITIRGNVISSNESGSGGAYKAAAIAFVDSGTVPVDLCTYYIDGNVMRRGAGDQDVGVQIDGTLGGSWDIRLGAGNVFDCATPILRFEVAPAPNTTIYPSTLNEGRYKLTADRVATRALWSGANADTAGVSGNTSCRTGTVQTTNAALTECAGNRFTPPTSSMVTVTLSASGTNLTNAWQGTCVARFQVSGGGVVTQIGTTTVLDSGGTAGSLGCAVGCSTDGSVIKSSVTGLAGQTWGWSVETGVQVVTVVP